MIWESHPWRVDLAKRAQWLLDRQTQRRWPEASCVRVEQCVMVGCYCVRKLIEAKKVTDRVARLSLKLRRHASKGKAVHSMNWHRFDELYNLQRSTKETRTLGFVCNRLIHSFGFALSFDEKTGGLDGLFFCSDRDRNKHLLYLAVSDLADGFLRVAHDDVVTARKTWNPKRADYDSCLD